MENDSHPSHDHFILPRNDFISNLAPIAEEGPASLLFDTERPEPDTSSTKKRRVSYTCSSCEREFTEKRSLTRHQNTSKRCHDGNTPLPAFRCRFCNAAFTRNESRKRHENKYHAVLQQESDPGETPSSQQVLSDTSQGHGHSGDDLVAVEQAEYGITGLFDFDDSTSFDHTPTSFDHISTSFDHDPPTDEFAITPAADTDLRRYTGSDYEILDMELEDKEFESLVDEVYAENVPTTTGAISSMETNGIATPEQEGNAEGASIHSVSSLRHFGRGLSLPIRSNSFLKRFGASTLRKQKIRLSRCPLCRKPFESNQEALLAHIKSHIESFSNECKCDECDIRFQDHETLLFHRTSAGNGHCGFINSEHDCTGHHPPTSDATGLKSHRHLLVLSFLWNSGRTQLDSLIIGMDGLDLSAQANSDRRWSWSATRRYAVSNCSSSVVASSFRSEPTGSAPQTSSAIGDIEAKLRRVAWTGTSTLIRNLSARSEALSRAEQLNVSLFSAIADRDLDRIQSLVSSGANVNHKTSYSNQIAQHFPPWFQDDSQNPIWHSGIKITPFALVTANNDIPVARLLLNLRADGTLDHARTLDTLSLAFKKNRFGIAALILQRLPGALDLGSRANDKMQWVFGLREQAAWRFLELVKQIETGQAKKEQIQEYINSQDQPRVTHALAELVWCNNGTILGQSESPLGFVLALGQLDCAISLLESDINCEEVLDPAMAQRLVDVFHDHFLSGDRQQSRLLLTRLSKVLSDPYREYVYSLGMAKAIHSNDWEIVFHIISCDEAVKYRRLRNAAIRAGLLHGPNIRNVAIRRYESLGTPLGLAARRGWIDLVRLLLPRNTDEQESAHDLAFALGFAVNGRHQVVVNTLLKAGANPNWTFRNGVGSILSIAATVNFVAGARALVQSGADARRQCGDDGNAFICAVHHGSLEVAEYLLTLDVNINDCCGKHGNALCAALARDPQSSNYLRMVQVLLAHGADPFVQGPRGSATDEAVIVRSRIQDVHLSKQDEVKAGEIASVDDQIWLIDKAIELVENAKQPSNGS